MLSINQFSWAHLLSMVLSEGTRPSRSLKRSKSTLLESRVTLLSPFRSLNCTILWPLQLRMPLTFTSPLSPSLLMNTRSRKAFLCVGSSVTWRRNLSSRTSCVPGTFWIVYVLLCCRQADTREVAVFYLQVEEQVLLVYIAIYFSTQNFPFQLWPMQLFIFSH